MGSGCSRFEEWPRPIGGRDKSGASIELGELSRSTVQILSSFLINTIRQSGHGQRGAAQVGSVKSAGGRTLIFPVEQIALRGGQISPTQVTMRCSPLVNGGLNIRKDLVNGRRKTGLGHGDESRGRGSGSTVPG